MRCRFLVSMCVALLCSFASYSDGYLCEQELSQCQKDICQPCEDGVCSLPEKCCPCPCISSTVNPNCSFVQRQCLNILCLKEEVSYSYTELESMCANTSFALPLVCGSLTEHTEEGCFSACNEIVEDSGSGTTQLLNLCLDIERTFCKKPLPERAELCADRCESRKDCQTLVESILEGEFTHDEVEASVNIILDLVNDTEMELGETILIVQDFHQQLMRNRSVAVEYFNDTSSQEAFIEVYEQLLGDDTQAEWDDLAQTFGFGPTLLESIEDCAELFSESSAIHGLALNFTGKSIEWNVELTTQEIYTKSFTQNISGEILSTTVELPIHHLKSNTSGNSSAVVSTAVVRNLVEFVHLNSSDSTFNGSNPAIGLSVLSVQLSGGSIAPNKPARLFFARSQSQQSGNESSLTTLSVMCVSWDFNVGDWTEVDTEWNDSHFICSTPHLTSFAVLVTVSNYTDDIGGDEALALSIVSYIGCAVSIVCLIITILALVLLRKKLEKGVLMYLHLNLSIALLVGLVIFVAGIETATSIDWLCTLIAALLHYFFLAVFCWMLAEGIMLYLLLVRVFGNAASRWYWLLPLGWGLPLPIVAVSVGIRHNNYGMSSFCWISLQDGTIWAFVGPMIAIILINAILLVITVVSILKAKKMVATEEERKLTNTVKTALKSAFILLPLLGVTWVFGLLAVNKDTTVFAWLFTIFNSLQGLFILILHVLRNDQVVTAIKRIIRRIFCMKKEESGGTVDLTASEIRE